MKIIEDVSEMRAFSAMARGKGMEVTLVPTMGCLHEGHRELLRIGKSQSGILVLSIFVNQAQFGPEEDFKSYPRSIEMDLKIAAEEGVDAVFAPPAGQMYPDGFETYAEVTELSKYLCGAQRPGHFRGVATIVLKLFNIVAPDKAVFGRKDYQQLLIIKKMVKDLNLSTVIIGAGTVREPDGLAMSSRNSYLDNGERKAAQCIPASLSAAREEFSKGERKSAVLTEKMKKIIEKDGQAVVEYIKICDPETLVDLDFISDKAIAALAVRIGRARLIDNAMLE